MEWLETLVKVFLQLDRYLGDVIRDYGALTYLILFVIVFCETGLVVTPVLPGDSLLFAAGAFAAKGSLSLTWTIALLVVAAVLGDTVNYWIGHLVGPRAFRGENVRFLNRKHLDRTHEFFEKYGGKTIIIARFVPIVRTFAPFVAGIGSMSYGRFFSYNVIGGLVWVFGLVLLGYYFGAIPVVECNFSLVILAIIVISILPGVYEVVRQRREAARARGQRGR
jgi:membrane-associated protein